MDVESLHARKQAITHLCVHDTWEHALMRARHTNASKIDRGLDPTDKPIAKDACTYNRPQVIYIGTYRLQ
jgi:hypothetical protein